MSKKKLMSLSYHSSREVYQGKDDIDKLELRKKILTFKSNLLFQSLVNGICEVVDELLKS